MMEPTGSSHYDAIVLGAGIAGLAAARALAEAGKRVLLAEAQAQVGGRMRTRHVAGLAQPIELGAEFIHGRPPDLLALLAEAKLATYQAEGLNYSYRGGSIAAHSDEDDKAWDLLEGMEAAAERHGDMSFNEYLKQCAAADEDKERARNYVEGFNAADAGVIGILGLARQQAAENAIEGDRAARVSAGYQSLAEYVRDRAVAASATLLLATPVDRVEWRPGACRVAAADGRSWTAAQVICALPLGVIQAAPTLFQPAPQQSLRAAHSLRAGNVQRLVLQFTERWWATRYPQMHFLFAQGIHPPTWWTTAPGESPLLTGWAGGPRARLTTSASTLASEAVAALEQMFHVPVSAALVAYHLHDWQADKYARGAYSYSPAGAGEASSILAQPVEGTLFFAGEHTDVTGHPGTVHGALRSGLRAAQQALTSAPLLST